MPSVDACPSWEIHVRQRDGTKYDPLTTHEFFQIIHKAMDNLKRLRCCRASLVKCQPVQSMQHRLDVIFSEKLFPELLCTSLSLVIATYLQGWAHLVALV